MTKADAWMPLYVSDYLRDTMHLSRDEHGAYMLLIMASWGRGGRLPNDSRQLAAIAKATPQEWRRLAKVILPFFEIDGDEIAQPRAVKEHEKAQRLSDVRRDAGKQGGRPKKEGTEQSETKPESIEKPNAKAKPKPNASQTETPAFVARPSPSPLPEGSYSVPDGTGADAPPVDEPPDDLEGLRGLPIAKGCWRLAIKVMVENGGVAEAKARAFVGKLKAQGLTDAELWSIAEDAWALGTQDPTPYLAKAAERVLAERRSTGPHVPGQRQAESWMEDFKRSPASWSGERGPRPGREGCVIPAEIQRRFGFEPFVRESQGAAA